MEYTRKVQYYETDMMGIVHHANYIRFFEEARSYYLDQVGFGYEQMEKEDVLIPTVSVECRYKKPLTFGDAFVIRAKIEEFNGVKLKLTYQLTNRETGELCAEGTSEHCFFDHNHKLLILQHGHKNVYDIFMKLKDMTS